jgi:hypothetical protein
MIKASYVGGYLNNDLFDLNNEKLNRDNVLYFAYELQRVLEQKGTVLATPDIHDIDTADIVIYQNMPRVLPKKDHIDKSYLILFESDVIQPENFNKNNHKYFRKIFTWHDEWVDNKKYFKINFAHLFPDSIDKRFDKPKLIALIAGNKKVSHPLELYSKRVEAIRWFEKNHPGSFSLYGVGWNKPNFRGAQRLEKAGLGFVTRYFASFYPSYEGTVRSKKETLQKFKFAICYENARDIPGYITEKIFDCFVAGCVPIYWGANNIEDYVPRACFVDKRDFASYESMYEMLTHMNEETYLQYQNAIEDFLQSQQAYPFTCKSFAETITREVFS